MATVNTSIWSIKSDSWGWANSKYPNTISSTTLQLSSGKVIPANAKIKKVKLTFQVAVDRQDGGDYWLINYAAVGAESGGSPSISEYKVDMTSHRQTLETNMSFTNADAAKFTSNTITFYAQVWSDAGESANTSHNTDYEDCSITVEWEEGGARVYYGTSNGWQPVTVYYGTSAGWQEAQVYYGTSNGWKP